MDQDMEPINILSYDIPFNVTNMSLYDLQGIFDSFKKNSYFTLHETNTLVLLCLYVPVFVLAIIGNVTVLLVIIPNRRMWSVTNNFLLNLAIADLLVTLVCIPMTVAQRIYQLWIYGDVLCKLTSYLQVTSLTASTLTITTMSLDRCLAIRHPMKFRNFRTTKYVRIVILVIWLISIFLALPMLIMRVTQSVEIFAGEYVTYCTEVWDSITSRQIYDVSLLLLMCIIPGITITVSYLLMGKRLWLPDRKLSDDFRYTRSRGSRSESERERSLRNITLNRRRLAKLCIVIAAVFILCWTPYFIVSTYIDFSPEKDVVDLSSFILLIGHVHCVTNPILYCFLHKTFRHYVLRCVVSRIKSQPNAGKFGQGYMTFYRTTPFRSHPRSSQKSLTSQIRRRSSSSSITHYKIDETGGRLCKNTFDHLNESQRRLIVNIISSASETLHCNGHSPKKLNIPAAIKEESKFGSTSVLNENHFNFTTAALQNQL